MLPVDSKSLPQSPLLSDNIVECCTQGGAHIDDHRYFVFPSRDSPQAFVKYGSKEMLSEARNQEFAFQALKQLQKQGKIEAQVRVPEIYNVIERGDTVYIVMEYIRGDTFEDILRQGIPAERYYSQIAEAIHLFLRVEISSNTPPGPIGKGIIRHPLFKDTWASTEYESVKELEDHMHKVYGDNASIEGGRAAARQWTTMYGIMASL